ncbi:hypothetical protein ACWOFR_17505 [Carnobacterium gallinarum]|uniref:hypothetical protein n=1 Tax=Carnobacterium gallinarum TaxID=2749 RepID=UPI000556ACBA|nr:hypothetical protein [Carnobacterium gallinarum]
MSSEEMQNQVDELVAGSISELLVKKEDFMIFRTIWLSHPQKNQIVGEAKLRGETIYRLVPTEN